MGSGISRDEHNRALQAEREKSAKELKVRQDKVDEINAKHVQLTMEKDKQARELANEMQKSSTEEAEHAKTQ